MYNTCLLYDRQKLNVQMCKNSNASDCIILFSKVCFRSTHCTFSRSWFLLIMWVTRQRFYLTREDWRNQTCLECLGKLENTDYTGKWSRFVELSKRLVQFSLDNFSCKFLLEDLRWPTYGKRLIFCSAVCQKNYKVMSAR